MRIFRSGAPDQQSAVLAPAAPAVVVAVVGAPALTTLVTDLLPEDWAVLDTFPDAVGDADLIVLASATGPAVMAARAAAPGAGIVGIVESHTATAVIVDVLEAGADACVRSGDAGVIAGHIAACRRRRLERA